jgi:L-seryl-tRNA(Ser) seleniumtransferase
MLLLRDHGILTVHFAALPPGTSALLLKFLPPETLERFGGPDRLATAVDESLDALAAVVADRESLAGLLGLSVLSAKS